MKIMERFGTNFVTRLLGLFVSPMPISEEQKTNALAPPLLSNVRNNHMNVKDAVLNRP
jgi:hypothetical protein